MSDSGEKMGMLGRVTRALCCLLLGYWGLYALVAPVTAIDSQMYHLARLELALRGGLFNSAWFTSMYQLVWPWGFDAVHLPFLILGGGYALPSFACFAGTCLVVHRMVRASYGAEAAWAAVAGLLGLTCLVYLATSTANDIPILFSGAVWVYARWRWQREQRGAHLGWMVLALGFMAGAKTTGALYAAVLAGVMLWDLRSRAALLRRVVAGLLVSFALLGSVETYVETARVYGHPLGPPAYMRTHRNLDGMKGGIANLSRYIAGSIYVGPVMPGAPGASNPVVIAEQSFLAWSGLFNLGNAAHVNDRTLFFAQSGFEELSGFGPVGTAAMVTLLASVLWWRPRALWWRLGAAAFAGLALVSFTVGYSFWGTRYLSPWCALATVACVCALWEIPAAGGRLLRGAFVVGALASALAAPWLSFNRGPAALLASVADRERFETVNYPLIGKVRERLRALRQAQPASRVFFVVCEDSVVLPILEDPRLDARVVTPPRFVALVAGGQVKAGDFVITDWPVGAIRLTPLEEVTAPDRYSKGMLRTQVIYRAGP